MVRNGHSVILFSKWLLSNITYSTKWLWCKIHMVRNGFWLWYEMVNYGTKWLWCKSARKRGLVGPYVKTTWTINNYCCLTYFFNQIDGNHKDTVWHLSKVLGNVKRNPYINQPKPYFFQKLIVKSFLDKFLQMLHQNIRNCLYFDWLFTHYVVMSDFYLYII